MIEKVQSILDIIDRDFFSKFCKFCEFLKDSLSLKSKSLNKEENNNNQQLKTSILSRFWGFNRKWMNEISNESWYKENSSVTSWKSFELDESGDGSFRFFSILSYRPASWARLPLLEDSILSYKANISVASKIFHFSTFPKRKFYLNYKV